MIIGELPISFRPKVENFLARFKAPIIAEALSGLRESNILNDYILKTDSIIRDEPRFDCVLRIGAVPVSDLWRSLERVESFKNIDVCSVTLKSGLPGLSRESLCLDLAKQNFECPTEICDPQWLKEVVTKDLIQQKKIDQLISDLPFSEAAIMRALSNQIPPNAFVYLGNSLPIREWSLFANFNQQNFECSANRGANGIDGQIASFLGAAVASGRKENWAILGDLTFLYDCNSLLLIKRLALKDINIRIIVINNSGGRIFEALPYFKKLTPEASQKADFLNEHSISCSDVANGFGIASLRLESAKINSSLPSSVVIEIIPSEKESEIFRKSYALVSAERS